MSRLLLGFAVSCVISVNAFGWGCEGHQIVASIARLHLSPEASATIDRLLRGNPIDPSIERFCKDRPADPMADAATWADDIKNSQKTGVWHYVDIPLTVNGPGSLASWCPPIGPSVGGKDRPGCITSALEYEWSILKDTGKPANERADGLRYVIHFVGDIHQPLHDSDNNDHGGNCTSLKFFAEDRPANLHAIWDYSLIQRELSHEKTTQTKYAQTLDGRFLRRWSEWGARKVDPVAWAWEGNALAKSVTYGDLKPAIPVEPPNPQANCSTERGKVSALHIAVSDEYFRASLPVIDEQLAKAGYRLAELLNETFR
ncbi:MAG: S1/P1 nuclease [Acidobacteriota bacterium]|nr:S1/P1 nuclease [Acidobacteriota bacterium]